MVRVNPRVAALAILILLSGLALPSVSAKKTASDSFRLEIDGAPAGALCGAAATTATGWLSSSNTLWDDGHLVSRMRLHVGLFDEAGDRVGMLHQVFNFNIAPGWTPAAQTSFVQVACAGGGSAHCLFNVHIGEDGTPRVDHVSGGLTGCV